MLKNTSQSTKSGKTWGKDQQKEILISQIEIKPPVN